MREPRINRFSKLRCSVMVSFQFVNQVKGQHGDEADVGHAAQSCYQRNPPHPRVANQQLRFIELHPH